MKLSNKVAMIVAWTILLTLTFAVAAFAAESEKPAIAVLFVNNAKTTYDDELGKKITDNINSTLSSKYTLVPGKPFVEKLAKLGITDLSTAERNDISEAFKSESINFVIYIELQPVLIKSWESFFNQGTAATVTLPLKVIDLSQNKYLYNGKFIEQADNSSIFGGVGTKAGALAALGKVLKSVDEVLVSRIPETFAPSTKSNTAPGKIEQ
ncbi:MAG TPA: hypothetical protein VN611_01140 [Patescibacteria group bacterium]|nr:hypothetical protein [Patescibacteria group bacterium]